MASSARVRPTAPPDGVLLVRARQPAVEVWAAKGVVPVDVAGLSDGWTAVVPVSTSSLVDPPYDTAVPMLLGRPLSRRLRPAIGVAVRGTDAVVALTSRRRSRGRRWLVWAPGEGLVRPGGLPVARLAELVVASGVRDSFALDGVRAVTADVAGDAREFLADLLVALGMPGSDLVDGTMRLGELSYCRRVHPEVRAVAGFEEAVHEERRWREELGL